LAEDYFLFGQLALPAPCANINIPLVKYRQHGAGVGVSDSRNSIQHHSVIMQSTFSICGLTIAAFSLCHRVLAVPVHTEEQIIAILRPE
jgi:hypothetical protein